MAKKLMWMLAFIVLCTPVFAEVSVELSGTDVSAGETITLTISPGKEGAYKTVYVCKEGESNFMPCGTNAYTDKYLNVEYPVFEGKQSYMFDVERELAFKVPADFSGKYFFSIYDYSTNTYKNFYFNVRQVSKKTGYVAGAATGTFSSMSSAIQVIGAAVLAAIMIALVVSSLPEKKPDIEIVNTILRMKKQGSSNAEIRHALREKGTDEKEMKKAFKSAL